jgi:hypothetical protein
MTYFLWHTIQDTNSSFLAIHDEEKTDLTKPATWWNYQLRLTGSHIVQYPFARLWPAVKFADPGGAVGFLFGQDVGEGGSFEPWCEVGGGASDPPLVVGQVLDPASNPLPGAKVQLYLTASGALISTGYSDAAGNYALPTTYAGQAHYVTANYGPDTYLGMSVDTLTPNA